MYRERQGDRERERERETERRRERVRERGKRETPRISCLPITKLFSSGSPNKSDFFLQNDT